MKAVQITRPGNIRLTDIPQPKIGSNQVCIKVATAGICGTDIHIFHGEYEANYPIIPGHEFSGTVVEVGEDVKYIKAGDRVTADPNIPCHNCPPCQQGYVNQCENLEAVGVTRDGAFSEYVVVPEGTVFNIGNLPYKHAAMVEPLACVVWGLKRIQVQPGDSALVFGAGPMGCLVAQALSNSGATQVVISDVNQWRLDLAKHFGFSDTVLGPDVKSTLTKVNPAGFHIVVDATGISKVLENGLDFVRPRGKLWVFGVVPPDEKTFYKPYEVFRKDLSIIGSFAVNQTFPEAIAMIRSGAVKVDPLISHQVPLLAFGNALEIAENDPNRMKVQIVLPL